MKAFSDAMLAGMALRGTKFIPSYARERATSELIHSFGLANESVTIVAGGREAEILKNKNIVSQVGYLLSRG